MADYFTDRVVEYPGRIQLTAVSGQTDVYDVERAEGAVTDEGTPFNAATFNQIAQNIIDLIPEPSKFYAGTCGTAQSTQTKVVECSEFTLEAGATIAVFFTYGDTYSGTTKLNVNNTGAIPIQNAAGETSGVADLWAAGGVVAFQYRNGAWIPLNPRRTPARVTGTLGSAPSSGQCSGWYDPMTRAVRLTWGFTATANVSLDDTLFTIPSAYRPASDVSAVCIVGTAAGTIGAGGSRITSGGIVQQRITSQARSGYGSLEYYV